MKYLTEESLEKYLNLISSNWIKNQSVPNYENKRLKPDYRNENIKVIVEFNGYSHYCNPKQIIRDYKKTKDFMNLGYKVISIPYFIQMETEVIKQVFYKCGMLPCTLHVEQEYPHGFIDKKCILPAEFCELGIIRFKYEIDKVFSWKLIRDEIILSLRNKIQEFGNINCVLPPSLHYLLD